MTIVQPKIEIRLLYSLIKYKHQARLYQQNKQNKRQQRQKTHPPPAARAHISCHDQHSARLCHPSALTPHESLVHDLKQQGRKLHSVRGARCLNTTPRSHPR